MYAVMKASLAFALLSLQALTLAEQTDMDCCTRPSVRTEQPFGLDGAAPRQGISHPVQLGLAGHATRHNRSG
jgi:hypothetical protein